MATTVRRAFTAEDHWSEWLTYCDGSGHVGLWSFYEVPRDFNSPFEVKVDGAKRLRIIRQLKRNADGSRVEHAEVHEKEGQPTHAAKFFTRRDGSLQMNWTILKADNCQAVGITHPSFTSPLFAGCDHRHFIKDTFPEHGLGMRVRTCVRLPDKSTAAMPPYFFGEPVFAEKSRAVYITYCYERFTTEDGEERYRLRVCRDVQEANAIKDAVERDVDFAALDYDFRAGQLPRDPRDWLQGEGWTGRRVSIEIADGNMWTTEGAARWEPPNISDAAMGLVLTAGEGYFYGPRIVAPVGDGEGDVVFETGTRTSEVLFQRIVLKYRKGDIASVDHEVYRRG